MPDFVPDMPRVLSPLVDDHFQAGYPVPEAYASADPGLTATRVLYAFNHMFGIPRGTVNPLFEQHVRDVINRNHPKLRCSAIRAILEGRVAGIPRPTLHIRSSKVLQQTLFLCDVFETVMREWDEARTARTNDQAKLGCPGAQDPGPGTDSAEPAVSTTSGRNKRRVAKAASRGAVD